MIWNGRACSWIVDKNCIFHRRCFNYAQIFPKNLQTPPDSIILVTMKICMDLQKVEKCHHRFIEGNCNEAACQLLSSIVLHTPAPPADVSDPTLQLLCHSLIQSLHNQNLLSFPCATPLFIALHCTNFFLMTDLMHVVHFTLPIEQPASHIAHPIFALLHTSKHFAHKTLSSL